MATSGLPPAPPADHPLASPRGVGILQAVGILAVGEAVTIIVLKKGTIIRQNYCVLSPCATGFALVTPCGRSSFSRAPSSHVLHRRASFGNAARCACPSGSQDPCNRSTRLHRCPDWGTIIILYVKLLRTLIDASGLGAGLHWHVSSIPIIFTPCRRSTRTWSQSWGLGR